MGDPKKQRKKFARPKHPWIGSRIESENKIFDSYGLKNKREIYKAESKLRTFKQQAKRLIARTDEQSKKEEKQLLERLYKLNLISRDDKLEDVLNIKLEHLLDRRLQTNVYKKGLAKTINQARQFIVHGHIILNNRKITVPSYLLKAGEEDKITISARSNISKMLEENGKTK